MWPDTRKSSVQVPFCSWDTALATSLVSFTPLPYSSLTDLSAGPQTFKDSEAPGYHSAYIAMLVGYMVKLAMVVVLYIYMFMVNKKRDREAGVVSAEEERLAIEQGMHDQTELDNKGFRYTL